MTKQFFLLLFIVLSAVNLEARENPFFPIKGESDLNITSNEIETFQKLHVQKIKLPDSARVLKKVTLTYQNIDGSLSEKSLKLNNEIDWHTPVLVTQTPLPSKKSAKKAYKSSVKHKTITKIKRFRQVFRFDFISFMQKTNNLKIVVKDKLLRNFMVVNPQRLVLDFKRDALFLTKEKVLKGKFFTKIRLGNHDGYYRVVLELDGKYRYKLIKKSYGCLITLY